MGPAPGYQCTGGSITNPKTCTEKCGDGIITTSEQCDDSNLVNLDGCSSLCTVETGWTCSNSPSPSSCFPICGDGNNVQGESCDDGNVIGTQGCKADCSGPVNGWACTLGGLSTP